MDQSGEAAAVVEIESTSSPPESKRPRRCVQSKLSWHVPQVVEGQGMAEEAEEKGEESEWSEGKRKGKRKKRKSQVLAAAAMEIENTSSPPESKRPRRCVQSKLSWHVPRVVEAQGMAEEVEEAGEESEWSEGERKGKRKKGKSQGKRKNGKSLVRTPRKSPVTNKKALGLSTRNKSNKNCQQLKNKETGNATPKKAPTSRNYNNNGSNSKESVTNKKSDATKDLDAQNPSTHQPSSDIWLETKIDAEENLRLSAGRKQTQTFFTCQKVESRHWRVLDGNYVVSCPPVHIFDTLGDDVSSLDWRNWVLMETTLLDYNGCFATENTSVFEDSVKPLKLDTICRKPWHLDQLSDKLKEGSTISAAGSSILSDGQDTNEQLLSNLAMVHVSSNISLSCCVGNLENEQKDMLLKERLASYHKRYICWPECSLWTNKYQPENALEVCGNSESIRFLGEWLKSWHERGLRSNKNKTIVEHCATEDSEDSLYENESDMDDGATLKNVLLITGPIGSGKSAAIYACAKEQGFEVIEVNASDLRNGAHIKQKIGEATESHGLNKWSVEDPVGPTRKHIFELLSGSAYIREDEDILHGMASRTCKQDATPMEFSQNAKENISAPCRVPNKTLILFEDVDIVFDEDRGFISAILHLAETSKRPIILTSNNKNLISPQLLDRFILYFTLPSSGELLSHLYMICVSEKAHISSDLLEHIIRSCLGDIRKTLMLLQFWCQGKRVQIGRNTQCNYSPLPFDIDAAHLVIPRIIPLEFPCELSEKVGEEISKTISIVEENLRRREEVKQQELNSTEMFDPSEMGNIVATPIKARRKALVKRNRSFPDCTEFSDDGNGLKDLSDTSDSPKSYARQTVKHRRGIVLSSQSDDELSAGDLPPTTNTSSDPNHYQLPDISTAPILQSQEVLDLFELHTNPIYQSRREDTVRPPLESFETASVSHICDTFNLQDVSCVPESSFISGNETNKEDDFLSLAISSKNKSVSLADFIRPIDVLPLDVNNLDKTILEFSKCLENNAGNACEIDGESVHGNEEVGNSQNEEKLPFSRYQLLDECSRADFSMQLMPEKNCVWSLEVDLVKETWRKLRCRREDLKSCLTNNRKDASLIVKLASRLTDLISNTDVMFSSCHPLVSDILDPVMTPCVEPYACSWYEEQFEMGSTYAQHGLCFYTNKCSAVGSNFNCENTLDLAQEMLTSSTNTMALGKLLSQGKTTNQSPYVEGGLNVKKPRCSISNGRDLKSALYNAILPMVPARLSMAVRGHAFHEYSSFMSQISKLECSRLSESIKGSQQQHQQQLRSRASRHYLSSGKLSLSPEHVELLSQSSCFRR